MKHAIRIVMTTSMASLALSATAAFAQQAAPAKNPCLSQVAKRSMQCSGDDRIYGGAGLSVGTSDGKIEGGGRANIMIMDAKDTFGISLHSAFLKGEGDQRTFNANGRVIMRDESTPNPKTGKMSKPFDYGFTYGGGGTSNVRSTTSGREQTDSWAIYVGTDYVTANKTELALLAGVGESRTKVGEADQPQARTLNSGVAVQGALNHYRGSLELTCLFSARTDIAVTDDATHSFSVDPRGAALCSAEAQSAMKKIGPVMAALYARQDFGRSLASSLDATKTRALPGSMVSRNSLSLGVMVLPYVKSQSGR